MMVDVDRRSPRRDPGEQHAATGGNDASRECSRRISQMHSIIRWTRRDGKDWIAIASEMMSGGGSRVTYMTRHTTSDENVHRRARKQAHSRFVQQQTVMQITERSSAVSLSFG